MGSLLWKLAEAEGNGFCSYKSNIFHISEKAWIYIKYKVNYYDISIKVQKYTNYPRIKRICHGLKFVPVKTPRKWEHICLETATELTIAKKTI